VVIFGGLLYLFVVPSLLLMTAEGVCRDGAMLPKKIKGLVLSEAAVCFFFIASSFWFPKTELGAVIFFGSFSVCALVLMAFWRSLAKGSLSEGRGRRVLMALSTWLACMLTMLPFVAVLRFVESGDMGGMDVKIALTCLLLASMFFSLLPGLMYLSSCSVSASVGRAVQFLLIGVMMTVFGGLLYPQIFRTIGFIALREAGAYEVQGAVFQLSTADLVANARLAKLQPFKPEESEAAKGDAVRVKAYLRYGFGDVVWLCSEPFDPLKAAGSADSGANKRSPPPGECLEVERKMCAG